ncbi:MAG: TolC family protein [Paraprevotella sp.]|nr:TolC family protein [Paraprevotella sp.]
MKRRYMIESLMLCCVLLCPQRAGAQGEGCETLLDEMERNNTQLQVLREEMEAARLENRVGLNLANPEVEFHYLWDTHGSGETRKDFSVMQTLDWATLTGQKRRIRKVQDGLLELQYRSRCVDFRLEAGQALVNWQYLTAVAGELAQREQQARRLAELYAVALDKGSTTALEAGKARMEHAMAQAACRKAEADVHEAEATLRWLNGGKTLSQSPSLCPMPALPEDFTLWYAQAEQNSPVLRYVKGCLELENKQVRRVRSENFPSLSVGYMTERGPVEGFQGLAVGLAVPLWENKNKVKQRKAAVKVAESRETDARVQFYCRANRLYERARELERLAADYRKANGGAEAVALLDKALAAGQLTLTDYYRELAVYYEATDRLLETERDYRLAVVELRSCQW